MTRKVRIPTTVMQSDVHYSILVSFQVDYGSGRIAQKFSVGQ